MVFKQVGNDTDSLINKFGLLNKSFANIKKDFQNGQGLRSFSNIVSKQDIANFDKFQQDLQRGVSYHKAFNNNLANSHTYIQQQAVRLRELNVQQKLLGRQLKTNKITQEEYRTAMSANQAQVKALTTKTQTLTFAQKASAVASKAAAVALNMLASVAIMAVINLIITGISKIVNQMKDFKEEIDNLKSDLDDTRSEIEDINSALDENKKKIEEINQNSLDITNKETLATLQLENAELERQKKLLEEIEKQKAKELNDKTVEYLNKNSKLNTDGGYWKSVWNNIINPDSIVDDFKQIFDKNTTWGEKALNIGKFMFPKIGDIADTFIPETRSIIEETEAFQNELDAKFSEIEDIFKNGISADTDFKTFSTVTADINELRDKLTANIDTLNTYKDSLSETSDEYKIVSEQIKKYLSQLDTLNSMDSYDISGFTDEYFKFDKGLNGYLLGIRENQNIDSSILELLGSKTDINGNQQYALTGNYLEQFKQAKKILDTLNNIELDRNLTFDESMIKSAVENYYNTLDKEIQKGKEEFLKGKSSEANNIFNSYIKNNPIENITKETYDQWREGLLKQARGDTAIEEVLNRMVNGISLDITKIIENKPFETTTQSLTELKESLDNAFSNQSIIQSAFDKIQEGSSLSADEVRKLVELCPQLSAEFVKTADGYTISADKLIEANESVVESTKQSLQERADYLKEFINTDYDTSGIGGSYEAKKYNEWQQSVANAKSELEGLELVLSMFGLTLDDTDDKLEKSQKNYDELSKSASSYVSNQKTLNSALEEQEKYGQLSASTIQELTEAGYAQALVVDSETGAVTLNKQAYEQLNKEKKQAIILEAKQQKTSLEQKYKDEQTAISDLTLEMKYANEERRKAIILELSQHGQNMAEYADMIDKINSSIVSLDAPNFGDSLKPQSVLDFEAEYARKQHEIKMGRMKEDEDYYSWLESAAKTAFEGLEDYQDDLWKYEEEVYKGRKQLAEDYFDEEQKLFEDRISNLETQIEITTKTSESSDGTKLNTKEKYDYIRSAYQEILNEIEERINEIVQAGVDGHEDLLAELEQQLDEYQEKLANVFKDAVEEEQDYIEKQKKAYSQFYEDQIDDIKEQQDAAEKAAQAEIDAIQEQIDALNDKNEKEQETNDIIEARQKLEKASQKQRAVFGSDGSMTYQVDQEKVKEAQEELDKLLLNKQISILEGQKEALESAKDKQSEAYDTIIENLETEKENGEKRFDILLQVLDEYLNPDNTTSNADVWSKLAKIEGAKYENGVWSDKDGNVIDIDELLKSAETKTDDKKSATDNSKSDTKDNGAVTGTMERMTFGSEKSDIENEVKGKTESAIDGFFAAIEKRFNLEAGSLTLEKMQQAFGNSPIMNFNPYGAMKDRTGLANKEYVSNVNNQQNNVNPTFTGDIHIHNPVGDGEDLAKRLAMELPNAFQKQIYTNLK